MKKIVSLIFLSLVLTSCASSSTEEAFNDCPNLDLTSIAMDESSPEYFEEVAKLVEEATKSLVGKSEKNVEYCAAFDGLTYRVAARDGEFFALTMDYIPTRINVEIEKSVVTKISVG